MEFSTKITSFSLLFLSLLFPTTTATCTNAVCRRGDSTIRFPFRLNPHQPQSCGYDKGFDLTCGNNNGVNRTTITLPFSGGDFNVELINYAAQEILLTDPKNCLPKRILTLNLTSTPFDGVYTRRFTFLSCPTSEYYFRFGRFNPIACLSDKNSTVFATALPREVNYLSAQSCRLIKSVEVPVRWPFDEQDVSYWGLSESLWLTWRIPRCRRCERRGGKCGIKSNSSREIICSDAPKPAIPRKVGYAIAIGAGIPGTLILFGIFCFVYSKINAFIKRRHLISHPEMNNAQANSSQSSIMVKGLDGSIIESYPKIVLGESKRLPKIDDVACAICLSEYESKETLRTIPLCQHCFHANCIDEWLKLNGTCPVCRNSPEQIL